MFFDTHLHLVDRKRLRYPWLAAAPALDQNWSYEQYEATARRIGITDVLHMEVDVHEQDLDKENAFIAELMAREGSLIRGAISGARPESAGFAAWLEAADRNVVKGIRRVLHTMPDELSRQTPFRNSIRRLGTADLPFDMCILARQLPLGIELADAAPDTVIMLDHCGVPDIAGDSFTEWASGISDLAKRPNVHAKISGISAYAKADWTLESLQPWVNHIIEQFGPQRVVWGSDSPVCTLQSNLAEWVATSQALIAGLSPDEQHGIRQGNARRIWKIG